MAEERDLTSFQQLTQAVAEDDTATVNRLVGELHPAELADALEALPDEGRMALWPRLPAPVKGEILTQLGEEVRNRLIRKTADHELVTAVTRLQLDELADLHEQLPDTVVYALLRSMDAQRRQRFETVRAYPENTAGGLMDADAIAVRDDVSLDVAMRYLRRQRKRHGSLPEHLDAVVVVDRDDRYLGILRLGDLISLSPELPVGEVMDDSIEALDAQLPAKLVARFFEDRDLMSAAVIDDQGRLIGRITVDDVIDVIREEGEHEIMRRAGLTEATDIFGPVVPSALRRGLWLAVNLFNAFISALVIRQFDASIEQMVALAVLMPVVASMGGVSGSQTLTLVIRGMALDQVNPANARRLLLKELGVNMVNGLFWAFIVALVASLWFENPPLGIVFATALFLNFITAALGGTLVPLLLQRAGIDPALAGGVILTAATDAIGFALFLGMATIFLL